MSEHRCARCDVVARNAPPSAFAWPRGWWPEPGWSAREDSPAARMLAALRDGELLCLACRRSLELAPPIGTKNGVRKAQRQAREAARAEHPDWGKAELGAYLGLPEPKRAGS